MKHKKCINKINVVTLVVGLISLLATTISFQFVRNYEQGFTETNVQRAIEDLHGKFQARIEAYQTVVYGAVGLENASTEVTREEWSKFVATGNIAEKFPGILGLGYAPYVKQQNKDEFIAKIKSSDLPNFKIWPEGSREFYAPVLFFEPESEINNKIIGYDMLSEAVRKTTMELAQITGNLSLTPKLELVLYPKKPAVLIFIPIYKQGEVLDSPDKRKNNLISFIYSPLLIEQFVQGINSHVNPDLRFQIFDGGDIKNLSSERLLYDSDPRTSMPGYVSYWGGLRILDWGENQWVVRYITAPGFGLSLFQQLFPWIILLGGILFSLVIMIIVRKTLRSYMHHDAQAKTDLEELEHHMLTQELIIDNEPFGLLVTNTEGLIIVFNRQLEKILNYQQVEVNGKINFVDMFTPQELIAKALELTKKTGVKSAPNFDCIITTCLIEGQEVLDWTLLNKQGQPRVVTLIAKPLYNDSNLLLGYEFIIEPKNKINI